LNDNSEYTATQIKERVSEHRSYCVSVQLSREHSNIIPNIRAENYNYHILYTIIELSTIVLHRIDILLDRERSFSLSVY